MNSNQIKKSPLYYVVITVIILCFIFLAWPQILNWDRSDVWVMGMPLVAFAIYLLPTIMVIGVGILYFMDESLEKKRILAENPHNRERGEE